MDQMGGESRIVNWRIMWQIRVADGGICRLNMAEIVIKMGMHKRRWLAIALLRSFADTDFKRIMCRRRWG